MLVLTHTSGLSVSFLHSLCAGTVFVLFTQPLCQCCLCPFYTAFVPVLSLSFLHSLCASAVFVLSTQPVCQCCLCPFCTACMPVLSEESANSGFVPLLFVFTISVCVCIPIVYVCVCVCVYTNNLCVCANSVCVCVRVSVPVVCACPHIMLTGENACLRFRQWGGGGGCVAVQVPSAVCECTNSLCVSVPVDCVYHQLSVCECTNSLCVYVYYQLCVYLSHYFRRWYQ